MIFFIILSVLFLLIAIFVPMILKAKKKQTSRNKSTPHSDNIKLWAKFPGDLETQLNHTFQFFDYSKVNISNDGIPLSNSKIILNELIDYNITNYDDKKDVIFFDSKKIYNMLNESEYKNITSVSMGIFELLETLTNQPLYQRGINGIKYLIDKIIGNSESFTKKLFTVYSHDSLIYDEERLKKILFSKIKSEKVKDKLYSDENYGFKTIKGYYKWIIILGNDNLIQNSNWINEEFSLSKEEIYSIVGNDTFLHRYLNAFSNKIGNELKCDNNDCGEKLIFYQLNYRNVTRLIGIENLKDLMKILEPNFEINLSPEMDVYFNNIFSKSFQGNYNEYEINVNLLYSIFYGNYSIYSPSNAINLLNMNKTKNTFMAYEYYLLQEKQMYFITNYIFEFLPNEFRYIKFKESGKEYTIDENARAFTNFLQILVDNSYGKLIKYDNLLSILRALIIWAQLDQYKTQNICEEIFQRTLDDGKRVLKICSNKNLNFSSLEVLNSWLKPYKCALTGDFEQCDMTIFKEINKVVYFSEEDLKNFYNNDTFGKYILSTENIISKHYNCNGSCPALYLSKLQYTTCGVTNNPPDIIKDKKSESIKDWDPKSFENPVELKFYQKNCDTDCNEKSNGAVLSLYNTTKTILEPQNSEAYNNRVLIESIYTLYMNKITNSELGKKININNSERFFNSFKDMIKTQIFNDKIYQEYSNNSKIILGNEEEDKKYIEILSNGDYSEGFKPKLKSTTGFNFYLNLKESDYDEMTIETKQNDDTQILRRIVKMNGFPIFNVKKKEYDPLNNNYIEIGAPLFNSYDIEKGDVWFTDGYQFDSDLDNIYYYDELSSRILKFDYDDTKSYFSVDCKNYILNNNISLNLNENGDDNYNLKETLGLVSQRFNKPFIISNLNDENIKNKINIGDYKNENYICVDPLSNMVLESNINLVYSIYTKNLGNIFTLLKNNDFYPVLLYNRKYSVSINSYEKVFEGNASYYSWRLFIIIFFLVCTAVCIGLGIMFYFKSTQYLRVDSVNQNISNEVLIPEKFDIDA